MKSVVPESVLPNGYTILNADNEHTVGMAKDLKCKIAYFSMNEGNPIVRKHMMDGGLAAVFENGYVTICKGTWKARTSSTTSSTAMRASPRSS